MQEASKSSSSCELFSSLRWSHNNILVTRCSYSIISMMELNSALILITSIILFLIVTVRILFIVTTLRLFDHNFFFITGVLIHIGATTFLIFLLFLSFLHFCINLSHFSYLSWLIPVFLLVLSNFSYLILLYPILNIVLQLWSRSYFS